MAFHQLVGFPIRDQLHDVPSKDGRPAEAAPMDCVAVSSAACLQWETGRVVSGDELKDVTYGEAHLGGGAEADYARTLPGYGLIAEAAWAPAGRPDILLAAIRKGVIAGHGVLCHDSERLELSAQTRRLQPGRAAFHDPLCCVHRH
jgi:hypothetical protein